VDGATVTVIVSGIDAFHRKISPASMEGCYDTSPSYYITDENPHPFQQTQT
jgi:hypothetical protein